MSQPWRRIADHGGVAVLLIRHGRTSFNASQRFCGGRSDPPLDEHGREQAAALGQRFAGQLDLLFCSPLQRARETAAALGREPIVIDHLRELDQGELEGREFHPALQEHAEFFRKWRRDPTHIAVPGGESMGVLADRVEAAVAQILTQLDPPRGRVVGIVCHQMTQAAFVCRALGKPLRDWPQFELRNATANLLAWDRRADTRGSWSLVGRNL
jgi:broad specificity phosphatase PhoE